MFLKFFFNRLSPGQQAGFMRKRGIVVGTRTRNGRRVYLYMVSNLFAEIVYEQDNPRNNVETLVIHHGLQQFHRHVENEMRSKQ